jgi:4-amino-4-deoxy-L-arabinose transferase-like glycosyltransferase
MDSPECYFGLTLDYLGDLFLPTTLGDRSGQPSRRTVYLMVLLVTAAIYAGCLISPPSLMDDVDAVQAQIARNMITSGDWVTPRLDGVLYLEKSPLLYWMMAICFEIFGVHDWAGRIPVALSSIGLAGLTAAFAAWAFSTRAALYAGLVIGTCVGVFLFTRIQIPDVILTFTITLAMWAFMRALDEGERHPRLWAFVLAASLGTGLLLKSLIALVFPLAAAFLYLLFTHELFEARTWRRLRPLSGTLVILMISAPWHILATLRNPPYFAFTMRSAAGEYHGFLWFYFINEQLLRFLNLRYPRDYDTVPRLLFWGFHLLWLFPWSVYFPALFKLSYKPLDKPGRARLLAGCWIGFVMVFFTFSTTQEYYSMPIYPALALLLGCAIATGGKWINGGTRVISLLAGLAGVICLIFFFLSRGVPAPGDISQALASHPEAYKLSLGHIEDLTVPAMAYLRTPLALAAAAFLLGSIGTMRNRGRGAFLAIALMMVLFCQAARLALVAFDPYLTSRPLADAINKAPPGHLVVDHHYYTYSSVFFYTNRSAFLLNGRFHNLVYGSYAPGAPDVFLTDAQFKQRWETPERYYFVVDEKGVARIRPTVPEILANIVIAAGKKYVVTNHTLSEAH